MRQRVHLDVGLTREIIACGANIHVDFNNIAWLHSRLFHIFRADINCARCKELLPLYEIKKANV